MGKRICKSVSLAFLSEEQDVERVFELLKKIFR